MLTRQRNASQALFLPFFSALWTAWLVNCGTHPILNYDTQLPAHKEHENQHINMMSFLTIFFWHSFRLLKWFHLWVNYLFTVLHSSSWTVLHCLSCNTWTRSTCDQIAEKSKSGWMHVSHRVWSLSTTRLSAQFGIPRLFKLQKNENEVA